MTVELSALAKAALVDHLKSGFRTGAVWFGSGEGVAALVSSGAVATIVVLATGENGAISFGKYRLDSKKIAHLNLQDIIHHYASVEFEDHGFTLSDAIDFFGGMGQAGFSAEFSSRFALKYPEIQIPDEVLKHSASAYLHVAGATNVLGRLNSEALRALRCVSSFDQMHYDYFSVGGERGLVRRQAADRFPFFAGDIASKFLVKAKVDSKASFTEALAYSFGVDDMGAPRLSPTLLRKFTHREFSNNGVPVDVLIDTLSRMPIDYFPKTEREWSVFCDLADGIFRRLGDDVGVDISVAVASSKGRWEEFAVRLAKAYARDRPADHLTADERKSWKPTIDISRSAMRAAASGARDVVHSLRNMIVLPAAANAAESDVFVSHMQASKAVDVAARIIYGEKSLVSIMEIQRHWHTQAHQILGQIVDEAREDDVELTEVEDSGWAPLCDAWTTPNGVHIVPLTDAGAIHDEGAKGLDRDGVAGLSHCVGGYAEACRQGVSHILSLRLYSDSGVLLERLSTVEFRKLVPGSNKLDFVQHRAKKDAVPKKVAWDALEWFQTAVASGELPLNHDGVLAYVAARRKAPEEVEAYCQYNWRDAPTIDRLLSAWRPYLPRSIQPLALGEFQSLDMLVDLKNELSPSYSTGWESSF